MSSRAADRSGLGISPVLFLSTGGEPMRFFLRPGATKIQLQHAINAGGGRLCGAMEPNAIPLANPEDMATVDGSTARSYVSTQYIRDSVERNQQLDVDDYRFNSESVQTRSARLRREGNWDSGRMSYTAEEDAAILGFISKRVGEAGGNTVWKEMAKRHVTNHPWQSMKTRFKKHLSHKVPTEEESFEMWEEDTPQPGPSRNQQGVPEPVAESKVPEPAPESELPEHSPESQPPELSPESQPPELSPESQPPELSPESEVPEPAAEPPSPKPAPGGADRTPQQQQRAAQRRSTAGGPRRQAPPSAKRARIERQEDGATAPSENADGDPVIHKEAGPTGKKKTYKTRQLGILEKASREFEESDDETPDLAVSGAPSPAESDTDTAARPQPRPDLRGVCPEAQGPSRSHPREGAGPGLGQREPVPSTSTDRTFQLDVPVTILISDSDSEVKSPDVVVPASPAGSSGPEKEDIQDQDPVPQMDASDTDAPARPQPRPEAPDPSESCPPEGAVPGPVPPASTAHMFLFESESQEAESSQPIRDEVAFSQLQVEEVKRRLRSLMKKTNRDLESVTKALLRTSGDWSASLLYLMDGKGAGPFWDRHDDRLLLAGRTAELRHKYGEEGVAKRLAFLDAVENGR